MTALRPLCLLVLLTSPTKHIPATYSNTEEDVQLDLNGILNILASMTFDNASTGSGATKSESKVLNFCGKMMLPASPKPAEKAAKSYRVAERVLLDRSDQGQRLG